MLAEIFTTLAINYVAGRVGEFLTSKENHLDHAIGKTRQQFPEIEGTETALRKWTSSEAFVDFFDRVYAGDRLVDEEIVASFVEESEFYLPNEEECLVVAAEILSAFRTELTNALYTSDEGLLVLANRQDKHRSEQTHKITAHMDAGLSGLEARLMSAIQSATTPGEAKEPQTPPDPAHREMAAKIDVARDLIDQGHVGAARIALEQLQNEAGPIPADLEFRIFTNLGACALADEDVDGARRLLEKAYTLQPDDPKAMANAALAAQFGDNSERAIELALSARGQDPRNSQATAVLLEECRKRGASEQLEELVAGEEWLRQDRTCGLVLASIRAQQSRFEEALTLCRSLTEAHPKDALVHLTLSECLLNYTQSDRLPVGYKDESFAQLREAEAEATIAIELFRRTDLTARRHEALVARAVSRTLLGAAPDALDDLNQVLSESPTHHDAAFNKGLLLLYNNEPVAACAVLESIEDPARRQDAVVPLAEACLMADDAAAAVKLLGGTLSLEHPTWEDIRRGEALCRGEAAVGHDDSVGPALEVALVQRPDDARLLALAAARRKIVGDPDGAESFLVEALEYADDLDREMVLVKLGTLYQELGRFGEAADLLDEAVNGVALHPAAVPLLECLVKSMRLRKALDWARRIRKTDRQEPRIAMDVEAQIVDYIGDTHAALLCRKELCSRDDATATDKVELALIQIRCAQREAARETVLGIDTQELQALPQSLLAVAQLKRMLGVSGHLEDAFLARRCGLDDPAIHLGYVGLFLGNEAGLVEPEFVGPGSAVRLKTDSEEEDWWNILDAGEEPKELNDLLPTDDLAKRLLGHRVGDTFVLDEGLVDRSYEITAVQSKFVRAFQETLEKFPPRFPENMDLSPLEIEDNDFTQVFLSIDQRHRFVSEVNRIYQDGRLPFVSFCSLVRRSVLESWHAITRSDGTRIRFGTGREEESNQARELLCEADGVVLDTLALLTVHELELAEHLRRRFRRTAVPQHVIDELRKTYIQTVMGPAPASRLGRDDDGRYTFSEISGDDWKRWQEYVRSVLEFAESFERVASYRLLDVDDLEKLLDTVTWAGAGAVYAGDEQSTDRLVLLSDDLGLSKVAGSLGIEAVNTQAILSELHRSDLISADDYSKWIERIVLLNYRFVRIRAEDIVRRLEANAYVTTEETRAMLRTLEDPDCSEDSAVSVGAQVIAELAVKALPSQIELILPLVLSTVKHGREAPRVLRSFREEIAWRLHLAPLHRTQILHAVDGYIQLSTG